MASQRKPLYADLFKSPNRNTVSDQKPPRKIDNRLASWSSNSSSGSSSWNQSLSFDSSSSGFSTPQYSDLGSSGSEDGDFMDELTRQIAECMLREEDEEDNTQDCNNNNGLNSSGVSVDDGMPPIPPIQVSEVKNKPPVKKPGRKRRVKQGTESTQSQMKQYTPHTGYGSGSGMQAVYLGGSGNGSGSVSGSVGTGVFLPRVTRDSASVTRDPVRLKKKSDRTMVLIPTRVMQVLEEYRYNRLQDSICPCGPKDESGPYDPPRGDAHEEKISTENSEMIMGKLPKEWTY